MGSRLARATQRVLGEAGLHRETLSFCVYSLPPHPLSWGAGEMVQLLRARAPISEDPGSIPSPCLVTYKCETPIPGDLTCSLAPTGTSYVVGAPTHMQ